MSDSSNPFVNGELPETYISVDRVRATVLALIDEVETLRGQLNSVRGILERSPECHNLQGTWVSPRAAWEPGRSEGEIKAEALREAADWFSGPLPDGTPNGRAYNSYRVAWILQERAASLDPADQVTDTEGSKS